MMKMFKSRESVPVWMMIGGIDQRDGVLRAHPQHGIRNLSMNLL